MREIADRARIEAFLDALAREATEDTDVFVVGGTSAVLAGWRDSTIDIDLVMRPTVPAPAGEDHSSPALAPDGRLLAFTSEVSGHEEVYVASWPGMNNRQTVSLDGGTEPRWTKNGRELVFRHGNEFLAVAVDPGSARLGTPQVLFTAPIVRGDPGQRSYDVTGWRALHHGHAARRARIAPGHGHHELLRCHRTHGAALMADVVPRLRRGIARFAGRTAARCTRGGRSRAAAGPRAASVPAGAR